MFTTRRRTLALATLAVAACLLASGCAKSTGKPVAAHSTGGPSAAGKPSATAGQSVKPVAGGTIVSITEAGGTGRLTFNGTKGQDVFVDIPATNLPDGCAVLTLLDPTGTPVSSGCLVGGTGFIDATILPATGQYTLTVTPGPGVTGQASVLFVTAVDQVGAITLAGPPVTATVTQPGAVSRLHFTGAAGAHVRVQVTASTVPDQCAVLYLIDPAGNNIGGGCIVNHVGQIDDTELTVDGQYTIAVDPQADGIGAVQVTVATV